MEPTLPESDAFHLADHRTLERRVAFFRCHNTAALNQSPAIRRQIFGDAEISPRLHRDNGR